MQVGLMWADRHVHVVTIMMLCMLVYPQQEAVKQLEILLQSPRFLRQLDINTVKLWPEDKIQCE